MEKREKSALRRKRHGRAGMPEVLALVITALSMVGVASIGGSSIRTRNQTAAGAATGRVEKSSSAAAASVVPGYADAERDVCDVQLD